MICYCKGKVKGDYELYNFTHKLKKFFFRAIFDILKFLLVGLSHLLAIL